MKPLLAGLEDSSWRLDTLRYFGWESKIRLIETQLQMQSGQKMRFKNVILGSGKFINEHFTLFFLV